MRPQGNGRDASISNWLALPPLVGYILKISFHRISTCTRLTYLDFTCYHKTMKTVILAAGFGSRLWPLSTSTKPKQFQPLIDDETLLQYTYAYLDKLVPSDDMYVPDTQRVGVICLRPNPWHYGGPHYLGAGAAQYSATHVVGAPVSGRRAGTFQKRRPLLAGS